MLATSALLSGVSAPFLSEQTGSVLSDLGLHGEPLRLAGTSQGALAQLQVCATSWCRFSLLEQPALSGGLLLAENGEGASDAILRLAVIL